VSALMLNLIIKRLPTVTCLLYIVSTCLVPLHGIT